METGQRIQRQTKHLFAKPGPLSIEVSNWLETCNLILVDWTLTDQKSEFEETVQRTQVYYEPSGQEVSYADAETACNLFDMLTFQKHQDNLDFMMDNRLSGKFHMSGEKILNSLSNRENFVEPANGTGLAVCSSGKNVN